MVVENDTAALFTIILVSDDPAHARTLITDLNTSKFQFTVSYVVEHARVREALERLTRSARRPLPVIVLLDFEFLHASCEDLAARIIDMKSRLAIECIVTRPPPFGQTLDRLRRIGAFLFDPDADFALPLTLLH